MSTVFYLAAAVATAGALLTITRLNAMHALLYLIVTLLALALVFFLLGAPFAALLEVIVYAGAIMVLFVFVVMMLNMGEPAIEQERQWVAGRIWIGPAVLAALLLTLVVYVLVAADGGAPGPQVPARDVAALLFGPYLLAVELASMLLLAALVGAYRVGRSLDAPRERPARGRRNVR